MRGKSLVRMNAPGTQASGPRPKLQRGWPTITSSPTLTGLAQFRCAVPASDFPLGWHVTANCWALGLVGAVLPLWKATVRLPSPWTIGSDPWSKSHALAGLVGSKKSPRKQNGAAPLISSGCDQVTAWSVDTDAKMAFEHRRSVPSAGWPQVGLCLKTVHVV